jgi:hypothetical protein
MVDGLIYLDDAVVGDFSRRLYYEKNRARAYHDIMEIALAHRGKRIAFHHYRKAIAFYERIGIEYVDMSAEAEGPLVWATFGFDLSKNQHRDMLMKIVRDLEIVLPEPFPSELPLAPYVAAWRTDDAPNIGMRAIRTLADKAGALPMHLDLRDPWQRRLLRNRGIL